MILIDIFSRASIENHNIIKYTDDLLIVFDSGKYSLLVKLSKAYYSSNKRRTFYFIFFCCIHGETETHKKVKK